MKPSFIIKSLPILSGLSIFSGFLKNYIFFKLFSINIIYYITIQDAMNWFLENIVVICISTLALLVYSDKFHDNLTDQLFNRKTIKKFSKENFFKARTIVSNCESPEKMMRILKRKKIQKRKIITFLKLLPLFIILALIGPQIRSIFNHEFYTLLITFLFAWYIQKLFLLKPFCEQLFPELSLHKLLFINYIITIFLFINTFSITYSYTKDGVLNSVEN